MLWNVLVVTLLTEFILNFYISFLYVSERESKPPHIVLSATQLVYILICRGNANGFWVRIWADVVGES
jgi:hypothetical protein